LYCNQNDQVAQYICITILKGLVCGDGNK